MAIDRTKAEGAVRTLLESFGLDPDSPRLAETPARVARMFEQVLSGLDVDATHVVKVLPADHHDEMVIVKDIPFYSLCEHHLLPFHGCAHVAYIPEGDRITGLSKLARVVELHARRLQLQERMTAEVADTLVEALQPRGVMVVIEAEHLCMTMRGVQKPGSVTVTSVVRGLFREKPATRSEAMSLIQGRRS